MAPDAELPAAAGRRSSRLLNAGGVTPFTATDYPGVLAAVVFVQGCPWRCGYCHNPHLQPRTRTSAVPWRDIVRFLERRVGLVDAVVFSGGEPTADPALGDAMRDARGLGFKIGLHSGGTHARRIEQVLPLVDWIGFDVKAPFADYARVTQKPASGVQALRSLEAVLASGVDYECRTTLHPALLPEADVLRLARALARMQVRRYVLQIFRPLGCADAGLRGVSAHGYPSDAALAEMRGLFESFDIRRG